MTGRFDVAIVGAGPAGSTTAMLLARHGYSVAVYDGPRHRALCVGETLPREAAGLLRQLSLWEEFAAQNHVASPGMMSAWGTPEVWATEYIFSPFGNGWHLDRSRFNELLLEAASRAGALVFRDTKIMACEEGADGWQLTTGAGVATCRFLVDAGGRASGRSCGPEGRYVADRLVAAAGVYAPASAASAYTLVEAVDQGWFYSALLPSGNYIVTYMTDADLYSAGRRGDNSFFESQLAKAPLTRERTGGTTSDLATFPAFSSIREHAAAKNWLAVGDAARSYDPLSGMGLCTAMTMAMDAAQAILQRLDGDAAGLRSYDQLNRQAYEAYRESYESYYGVEQRWPDSEFWRRRHQGSRMPEPRPILSKEFCPR
jgi:flavin-dependent dehydrogenase